MKKISPQNLVEYEDALFGTFPDQGETGAAEWAEQNIERRAGDDTDLDAFFQKGPIVVLVEAKGQPIRRSSGHTYIARNTSAKHTYIRPTPAKGSWVRRSPRAGAIVVKVAADAIYRGYFAQRLVNAIANVAPHAGSTKAAIFVETAVETMREYRDSAPSDPLVRLVMAMHDAIVHKDAWLRYTPEQYGAAASILGAASKKTSVSENTIKKCIGDLERNGFNTTPFGSGLNWADDD